MIQLYSFGADFGMVDPSPFVLKVDVFLRMTGIEYEIIPNMFNLRQAPKGKLPFIVDEESKIADSEFIIAYLQNKFSLNLDKHLSSQQKSLAYLIGKSLDENLYWCLVYSRWGVDETWVQVKQAFFGSMVFPLNALVPPIARYGIMSALQKQGIGRHSDAEIQMIARKSFAALAEILGQQKYFFGDSPCTFDATAYAFLSQFINVSLDNDFNDLARGFDNLVGYCDRIKSQYY